MLDKHTLRGRVMASAGKLDRKLELLYRATDPLYELHLT